MIAYLNMMTALPLTFIAYLGIFLTCVQNVASNTVEEGGSFINAVYLTSWGVYERNYQPTDFPAEKVSHLLYAFANLNADGTVFSGDPYADTEKHYPDDSWNETGRNVYGSIKQLFKLKQAHRNLKVLLSVGGWTWSTNFPAVAATEQSRSRFAQTSVGLMKDWGFDGIDVDWEYPSTDEDSKNMVLLLKTVREELDRYATDHSPGHHFELSIAAPAGPHNIEFLDIPKLDGVVDRLYLMAYDFAGSWDDTSGHQANIFPSEDRPSSTPFSIQAAVDTYRAAGLSLHKLILGMPIYGRAFVGTDGPGLPYASVGNGDWESGVWDYKSLPKPEAVIKFDDSSSASYTYDATAHILVSYDTPSIVRKKIDYAKANGLGGSMFWEASADKSGTESLIGTAWTSINGLEKSKNQLHYPASQYDNIRNSLV